MRNNPYRLLLLALVVVIGMRSLASAGDCCCAHCGCHQPCQKVCRLVCEEKKVDVICWGCQCEHFCMPKHSKPGCRHCEAVCESCEQPCDCTQPRGAPKKFVWTDWIPGCAKVYAKKKLMQKIVTKTVPSYTWVVEELCPACEANCAAVAVAPGAVVPPPGAVSR